ncbi:protein naked cuticle homolog 2-like [Lytechinus pictus]|uniref:protein naked cuticle homolog 2-like n=1 Tax=Lytechinus pictus TaxID=7653 RepID=UPI0030B9EB9F
MGKSQSRPGSNWSWSYKRRENPEGDSYILRGCINARYRDSEEHLWTADGSPDHIPGCKNNHHGQPYECSRRQSERPMNLHRDICSLKVDLPPEVTGSRCSLKVQSRAEDSPTKKQPPASPSSPTIGAVDCDVSLDAEKETQEWAFTLYDFDGHRRITREDLSSILKSISEALACSVILPPSGSRKLKLRLSMVSDHETDTRKKMADKASQPSTPSHDNLSQQQSVGTQSTSLPSASPLDASPLFNKQENKENLFNRVRDRGDAPSHRHSFNVNHQCWRKEEKRSRRSKHRSHSMAPADVTVPLYADQQASPERHHRKARKSTSALDHGTSKMTPSKQTSNAGTNCVPVERPQENAERRSYYQELAGIDHQCTNHERDPAAQDKDPETELPLGASASSPNQVSHRHLKTSPHHRRAKTCDPQVHGLRKQTLHMNQELFAKYEYAQRHHKDYHMQLLEASRTRLEGMQPVQAVSAGTEAAFCQHSPKRHSFPAGPVKVVTTQVVAPAVQAAPVNRGKHRRRSRRHHTLQPLTVMKHEVMEKSEGVGYNSPVPQKHQHHHHHEHHHHHHYHHYHDID